MQKHVWVVAGTWRGPVQAGVSGKSVLRFEAKGLIKERSVMEGFIDYHKDFDFFFQRDERVSVASVLRTD